MFVNCLLSLVSFKPKTARQCKWFSSELGPISGGVPQGTILGPLLFLIYINDLLNCLKHCTARLYADDTSLNTSGSHIKVIEPLMNADLKHVSSWLIANKLTLNVIKTVYMVVGSRQRLATLEGDINLQINSTSLKGYKIPNVSVSKLTKILRGKDTLNT